MNIMKLIVLAVAFFGLISTALANGAGNEIEKTANGFSFEFGIEPKELKAGERAIMSLSVHNASTGKALEIGTLWVRISKNDEILFTSGDFRITSKGPMFFGYSFKESGDYMIDFSFKQDGKDVKTSFNVSVKKGYTSIFGISSALALAFIFGFIAASIIRKAGFRREQ